jgi:hypothetical protein
MPGYAGQKVGLLTEVAAHGIEYGEAHPAGLDPYCGLARAGRRVGEILGPQLTAPLVDSKGAHVTLLCRAFAGRVKARQGER